MADERPSTDERPPADVGGAGGAPDAGGPPADATPKWVPLEEIEAWLARFGGSLAGLGFATFVAGAVAIAGCFREPMGALAVSIAGAIAWSTVQAGLHTGLAARAWRSRVVQGARAASVPLLLVAISVTSLWPAWSGRVSMFLDQDNTTHLERARLFDLALERGRWPAWTNLFEGGESLGDMYGWLGNLVPPLLRALSFKTLTFERAYVCGIASLHAATALSTYALARRFSRRAYAFAFAAIPLIGGHVAVNRGSLPLWQWHLHDGVWHSLFAGVLAIFAAAKLVDVARRGRTRDVVFAALLCAAACVSHGFGGLAVMLLSAGIAFGAFLSHRVHRRRATMAAFAAATGLALAGAWLVPASRLIRDWALSFPMRSHDLSETIDEFFGSLSTLTLLFGGVACLVALLARDRLLRGVAFAALVSVAINSNQVLGALGFADTDLGRGMQWHRLTLLFTLVAPAAMAAMLTRATPKHGPPPFALRTLAARSIAVSLLMVFLLPQIAIAVERGQTELRGFTAVKVQDPSQQDRLAEWLSLQRAQDPAGGAFRVFYATSRDAVGAMALASRSGVPVMVMHYASGMLLKNRLQKKDRSSLRAWGGKYMVVDAGSPVGDGWQLALKLDTLWVLRDEGFPGLASAPAGVEAIVTSFSDDEIRVQVKNTPASGADVQLAVAYYPRFRATQNGREVAVNASPAIEKGPPDQLVVHVGDGEVVLRPDGPLPGHALGLSMSLAGAIALVGFSLRRRLLRIVEPRTRGLHAASTRARDHVVGFFSRAPTLRRVSLVAIAAGVSLLVIARALPRRATSKLGLRWFGGDRGAVSRFDSVKKETKACPQSLMTRTWSCRDDEDKTLATVAHDMGADPAAPPGSWPLGRLWSSLRVTENDGQATIRIYMRRLRVASQLHLRMSPVGTMPKQITVRVGALAVVIEPVHGYRTVPLPNLHNDLMSMIVEVEFDLSGGIDLAGWMDDDPTDPELPKQ